MATLKAVVFDMDDTLLSINLNAFIGMYALDEANLLAQAARKSAETAMQRLRDGKESRDDKALAGIEFESLGVDMLIVDEAHHFKNLGVPVASASCSTVGWVGVLSLSCVGSCAPASSWMRSPAA